MAIHQYFFALSSLAVVTLSVTINGIRAIIYYEFENKAGNSTGAVRFNRETTEKYAIATLKQATIQIWRLFEQKSAAERKDFHKLVLRLENFPSNDDQQVVVASARPGLIRLNVNYVARFHGDVKFEITGVLIHELTHLLQWDGNGQAPDWLIEGIADYVRLKSGFIPNNWAKPGDGKNWQREKYDVVARFLVYLPGYRSNFVAELTKKLRSPGYTDDYFRQLLGKTIYALWGEYKRFYGI